MSTFYGREWYSGWLEAADQLLALHEAEQHAWPLDLIMDLWEELWWRWSEELRELDRQALRQLGDDNPTYDRYRWAVTVTDGDDVPWLRMPRIFHLFEPEEYFMQDVLARHNRKKERALWSVVW